MRIDFVSLFPSMFLGPFDDSILRRARDNGILDIHILNPRDFAFDRHKHVDDSPFGGGSGMVLKPEPIFRAMRFLLGTTHFERRRVLLMSPDGEVFTQNKAKELSAYDQLIFLCGHYEGFDARITELADEVLSIGDYVLTGGELPSMVMVDAVARMLPGVLGSEESAPTDSFYHGLLEYPQYTRPRDYHGKVVPEVLFSGDHAKIASWRRQESLRLTFERRPDLLEKAELSQEDRDFLIKLEQARKDDQ
ncbi:MAG: tRNA (guanosine(37)-N1)-methyltransferase TrmD [Schwartzia sp.]|nr:tRNA (guanosine(37)-N1)-methyltransferase TrmD [Schwartzia sp. (in: firmicutes)]